MGRFRFHQKDRNRELAAKCLLPSVVMTIASSVIVVSTAAIAQAVLHVTSSSTALRSRFILQKAAFSVTLAVSVKCYFDHQSFGYGVFCTVLILKTIEIQIVVLDINRC